MWSPAPPRSARLASMRARTQALLTASPPAPVLQPGELLASVPLTTVVDLPGNPSIDNVAATTTTTAAIADEAVRSEPDEPIVAQDADDDDTPVLSDLSLSRLDEALPSPVIGSGPPPVFELGASPPLLTATSLAANLDVAAPTFSLDVESLNLSPLAV